MLLTRRGAIPRRILRTRTPHVPVLPPSPPISLSSSLSLLLTLTPLTPLLRCFWDTLRPLRLLVPTVPTHLHTLALKRRKR
ncbi:hypothetical protein M422DRAFT_36264 [Sphaerobolus stellatus SS14]|uniref:Uncharacterized protein n=1 Tax=Sphaerobolus stellatus (strain SS14) TaxID=990650 RepID=A0A0C9V195_SPHS4|nr:hypothetical protein M422DRAFT_36264 [Sphaerobolus stellatus SS14]